MSSEVEFAAVMVPANGQAWWWYDGITAEQVGKYLEQNNAMLTDIDAYIDDDNTLKFVVVMVPATGAWWWYWGQTGAQVGELLTQNKAHLTDISAYIDTDGTLKFAVIMDQDQGAWWWYWGQTGAQVGELLTQNKARLTDISAYIDTDGTLKFAVIMDQDQGAWWWYWGQTGAQVGELLTQNKARLTDISAYIDTDGTLKFAVIMEQDQGAWWWYWGQTGAQLGQLLTQNKARLAAASGYVVGYYFIKSKLSGNVIDIVGASTESGAGLDAYPQKSSGTNNQLWEFVPDSSTPGYFLIKSKLNGNVIEVPEDLGLPGVALNVTSLITSTAGQLWQFYEDPAGSGYYYIMSKLNGFVIDIEGASTKPGALLDLYPPKSSGTDNQLWQVVGGSFPSPVPPVQLSSLGSNSNYLMSNCANLTDVSLMVNVTQDIVGSDGFGFQLNAYSAKGDYDAAQQYLIYLDPHSSPAQLYCMVDNWTITPKQAQVINHIVSLATLPSQKLPAGYALNISLQNDSSGNITGAQYTAFDNNGNSIGTQPITLLSLNTVSGSPVTSADLAPIVSFQVDFVDYLNGGVTTLSSGAGYMTMGSNKTITVDSSEPSCVDWDYVTVERANSSYGQLPANPNGVFTQTFQTAPAGVVIDKQAKVRHITSRPPG